MRGVRGVRGVRGEEVMRKGSMSRPDPLTALLTHPEEDIQPDVGSVITGQPSAPHGV